MDSLIDWTQITDEQVRELAVAWADRIEKGVKALDGLVEGSEIVDALYLIQGPVAEIIALTTAAGEFDHMTQLDDMMFTILLLKRGTTISHDYALLRQSDYDAIVGLGEDLVFYLRGDEFAYEMGSLRTSGTRLRPPVT